MKNLKKSVAAAALFFSVSGAFAAVNSNPVTIQEKQPVTIEECSVSVSGTVNVGVFSGTVTCTASAKDCPTASKRAINCVKESIDAFLKTFGGM